MTLHTALAVTAGTLLLIAGALELWSLRRFSAELAAHGPISDATFRAGDVAKTVAVIAVVVAVGWLATDPDASWNSAPSSPRARFCETHECIGDWENARGARVQCTDGAWSFSGGVQGACSGHGGVRGGSSFGTDGSPYGTDGSPFGSR